MIGIRRRNLQPLDGAASDEFGQSVSFSGDIAIIGAFRDDGNKGSAYVFERDAVTGNWNQTANLLVSDRAFNDWFGTSVSISGNVVVVGATGKDDGGSAYVFERF